MWAFFVCLLIGLYSPSYIDDDDYDEHQQPNDNNKLKRHSRSWIVECPSSEQSRLMSPVYKIQCTFHVSNAFLRTIVYQHVFVFLFLYVHAVYFSHLILPLVCLSVLTISLMVEINIDRFEDKWFPTFDLFRKNRLF